jgi:hypothetical protein
MLAIRGFFLLLFVLSCYARAVSVFCFSGCQCELPYRFQFNIPLSNYSLGPGVTLSNRDMRTDSWLSDSTTQGLNVRHDLFRMTRRMRSSLVQRRLEFVCVNVIALPAKLLK